MGLTIECNSTIADGPRVLWGGLACALLSSAEGGTGKEGEKREGGSDGDSLLRPEYVRLDLSFPCLACGEPPPAKLPYSAPCSLAGIAPCPCGLRPLFDAPSSPQTVSETGQNIISEKIIERGKIPLDIRAESGSSLFRTVGLSFNWQDVGFWLR